jgi:peptidoglycan/LPS O-acetylase OafA/YrhL
MLKRPHPASPVVEAERSQPLDEGVHQAASPQPIERSFRPDVEGLRALSILLVVIDHAGLPGFQGGYVGVDVFFVISGFVITGLLLREVGRFGRPRFGSFYARRAKRILPAAGLVTVLTVAVTYFWLGFIRGNYVADDSRWVAVFLGNVHFAAVGTDYFQSQLPVSPLQNFWSLAVEEQFYVVYPAAIFLLTLTWRRWDIRRKVMLFAGTVLVFSLLWSIHSTAVDGASAYFSIWTRAWELALGGFVASGAAVWSRLKPSIAILLSWAGIAAIVFAATQFSSATVYPGWPAVIPVGGAALVILGGTISRPMGAETILGLRLSRLVGKLSYSIYLWHWPVLILVTQAAGKPLTVGETLACVGASVVAAGATYWALENPIRYSKWLAQSWIRGVALGVLIIVAVLAFSTYEIGSHSLL